MGWFRTKGSQGGERGAETVEERLAAIEPGSPGHCPSCNGLGYIDNLDIGGRFQIQHCRDCGHRWEYLFDAEGHVVGLTELDDEGQPVARMRVRTRPPVAERRPAPEPTEPAIPIAASAPPLDVGDVAAGGDADVLDLRDPAPVPEPAAHDADEAPPEQMSAAEWLRHAVGR